MVDLQQHRNNIEQLKGKRKQIEEDIFCSEADLKSRKRDLINVEQAQTILQTVAKQTQQELEYHISDIVSLAIESVFDDPYKFKIEFVEKRGKTECEIWFIKDKKKFDPKTASGGGIIDVASFTLRLALWNLKKPKSRNTLILDEPFKHLKGFEENVKVIQTIKLLSEKLGLQIIMVHDERVPIEEIKKGADKIFEVSIKKGVSKVI